MSDARDTRIRKALEGEVERSIAESPAGIPAEGAADAVRDGRPEERFAGSGPDLTPKDFGAARQAQRAGLPPVPRQGGHGHFEPRIARRKQLGTVFVGVCLGATLIALAALALLLGKILYDGLGALSWRFVTSFPSRFAAIAGIKPALVGTAWILGLTAVLAFPLGV